MINYFTFGGQDSRTYGVYISGQATYNAPERAYEPVAVPGRNGALLLNDNRLENVELIYPAFISADFKNKISLFKEMLLSQVGYQRLEDSYNPDEYRKAFYRGNMAVEATALNNAGQFEVAFECKPQRYLKSGESATTFTASGTISNPTKFDALPLIKVTGYGTLTINTDVITIASGYTYVNIDSETMDCSYGTVNANNKVSFSTNDFPKLKSGSNTITIAGSITKVEITPRWYRV